MIVKALFVDKHKPMQPDVQLKTKNGSQEFTEHVFTNKDNGKANLRF